MPGPRHALLLLPLIAAAAGCSSGGLAGGEGDRNQFYSVPPVPSPPLVTGTRVVRCEAIATSPVSPDWEPERQDRYQAVDDTTTLTISDGPSANTRFVQGEWLDPRIDDAMLVRDRGGQRWVGTGGTGAAAVTIAIETDASGAPLRYIVSKVTTPVYGDQADRVAVTRTFGFAYVTPSLGGAAGLYVAHCIVQSGDFAAGRPMDPGTYACLVANRIGVTQWEQDTFTQHYRVDPFIPALRGQFTAFNGNDVPPNVEYEDILFLPPLVPRPFYSGFRTEREHALGNEVQAYAWADAVGATYNQRIVPIDSRGTWRGDAVGVQGTAYLNHPYYLRDGSDISFTVRDDDLEVVLTANTVTKALRIHRLERGFLHAVRRIDDYTYEALTLERRTPAGSTTLTASTSAMSVALISRNPVSGAETVIASYAVTALARGP